MKKGEVGLSRNEREADRPVCGGSARDERVGLMCWRVDSCRRCYQPILSGR